MCVCVLREYCECKEGWRKTREKDENEVVKKSCARASIVRKNGYSFTNVPDAHAHYPQNGW